MANPKITRTRVLGLEAEGTTGTAETLLAADAVMNVYDPEFTPQITSFSRQSQGTYDAPLNSVTTDRAGRITFRFDCIGDNTTAPLWMSDLAICCGFSLDTVTLTANGSRNANTATVGIYQDGLLKRIAGAMGTLRFPFTINEPLIAEADFLGKYVAPSDASILAPTHETKNPPVVGGATLTIGSYTPTISTGAIVVSNELKLREDVSDSTGYLATCIVQQTITVELDPEAEAVATKDWYGELISGTTATLTLTVGSDGNQLIFTVPGCQVNEAADGDRGGIFTHPVTLLHTGTDAMTIEGS